MIVVFEAFWVGGPGGLNLVEGHGGAVLELGCEGLEAEEAVFYCRHCECVCLRKMWC